MRFPDRHSEDQDAEQQDVPDRDGSPRPAPAAGGPLLLGASAAPADALRRFRLAQADLMPVVRRLELDWPCCVAMMQRFAEYVTNVPAYDPRHLGLRAGPPVPVLFLCLQKGLGDYDAAADESDDRRLVAFIDGLCLEAARLLCGVALFKPDNDCWMAGNGVALYGWLASGRADGVTVHRSQRRGASHERVVAAIAQHVVSARERTIVDRVHRTRAAA